MNKKMDYNEVQRSKQCRLTNLDVIKGVCILMIVFTHFSWNEIQRLVFLFPFWIDMAVPFFMTITGFVSALSYNKKNLFSLKKAYNPISIISKCIRYIIPFMAIYAIEVLIILISHQNISKMNLAVQFAEGGYGPGSYYVPVMIQIMIIIPLVYYLIDRINKRGLLICFVITILYEVAFSILNIPDGLYRLCSFRYIFIVSFGCYLFKTKCSKNKVYWIACVVGLIFIILFKYVRLNPYIINKDWVGTSVFAVLFILPVARCLIGKYSISFNFLELLGKASYNIFLVQMLYYSTTVGIAMKIYNYVSSSVLRLFINYLICCTLGVLFYKIESPLTKRIIRRIKRDREICI